MTDPNAMNLREYVQLAAAVEDAVATVYELFGAHFAANVEFSHFWRLCAEAERYHAATIRLHEMVLPLDARADESKLPNVAREVQDFLEDLHARVQACQRTPVSPKEALDLAYWIESQGSEVHGRTQFAFLHPAMAELFQHLEEEDRVHRQTFDAARARFAPNA